MLLSNVNDHFIMLIEVKKSKGDMCDSSEKFIMVDPVVFTISNHVKCCNFLPFLFLLVMIVQCNQIL